MFKVGEIVVGQHFIHSTHRNGMEGTVASGLKLVFGKNEVTGVAHGQDERYFVEWADGDRTAVKPHNLRRRKPPTTGEDAIMALLKRAPQREPELA